MDINPDGSIRVSLAPNIYAYDGGFRTYDTIQDVWLRNLLAANPGLNPVVAAQLVANTPKDKVSTPATPKSPAVTSALKEAEKNKGKVYQEETALPEPGLESPVAPVLAMAGLGGLGTILGRAILDAIRSPAPEGEGGFVTGTHKFKKPVNEPKVPALPEPTEGYYTGNTRPQPSPTPPLREPFNPRNMDLYTRWFNQASGPEQQSFWDSVWNAESDRLPSVQRSMNNPQPPNINEPYNRADTDLYRRWFARNSGPAQQAFWDSVWNAEADRLSSTQAPRANRTELPSILNALLLPSMVLNAINNVNDAGVSNSTLTNIINALLPNALPNAQVVDPSAIPLDQPYFDLATGRILGGVQ